jgi:hypothetical protein
MKKKKKNLGNSGSIQGNDYFLFDRTKLKLLDVIEYLYVIERKMLPFHLEIKITCPSGATSSLAYCCCTAIAL